MRKHTRTGAHANTHNFLQKLFSYYTIFCNLQLKRNDGNNVTGGLLETEKRNRNKDVAYRFQHFFIGLGLSCIKLLYTRCKMILLLYLGSLSVCDPLYCLSICASSRFTAYSEWGCLF